MVSEDPANVLQISDYPCLAIFSSLLLSQIQLSPRRHFT